MIPFSSPLADWDGRKTLWEKEKMIVTSIFSFSHYVFKRLLLERHENMGLFGKVGHIRTENRSTWQIVEKPALCKPYFQSYTHETL